MMRRYLVSWLLPLLLAGCATGARAPDLHYYRLPEPAPANPGAPLTDVISVAAFTGYGLLGERPVVYADGPGAIELGQYHYHYWVDSPPRMIRDQLIAYLRSTAAAGLVLARDDDRDGLRIAGVIRRFERVRRAGGDQVSVTLEIRVERGRGALPVLVREYARTEDIGDPSMDSTVNAFGRALESVFASLLDDLRSGLSGR